MATNENVNKVIYGNQTVMDITDTTAEESDVASGEVFYKANGARSVGTLNKDSAVWGNIEGTLSDQTDLQTELNRAYTKTASETSSIDDLDLIPVQKILASSDGRRNIKFRNLKSVLKTYFDNIYSTFSGSFNDLTDKPTVDQTYSATSSNAQSGKAVASAISGKADTSLLKSTVGWTGKNKLHIPDSVVSLGVFTVNRNTDGEVVSIGVSGTPSADQDLNIGSATNPLPISILSNGDILSKGNTLPSTDLQQQIWYYDNSKTYIGYQNEQSEGCSVNKIVVSIPSGAAYFVINNKAKANKVLNTTLYPMLRDASITDDTYEPYHESVEEVVEQIYADNGVVGAKNLLPNNATSQTKNGVTFTVNADGSVTANGTATASTDLIVSRDLPLLYGGRYILSGCPSGGAVSKYRITAYRVDSIDGQSGSLFDIGDGLEFTYKNMTGNARFIIYIENGVTVDNLTFYPMLRLASDPDDTYVPYAMTNRELTDVVTPDKTAFTDTKGTASVNTIVKTGNIVVADLRTNGLTTAAWESIATIPAGYRPANNVWFVANDMTGGTLIRCALNSEGTVTCPSAISNKEIYIHAFWSIV